MTSEQTASRETSGAPAGPARRPVQYFLVLMLVNLMWAFQFSGAKIATERLGPVTVTFIPLALSTLLFAPLVRLSRGGKPGPRFTPIAIRDLILAGTIGIIPAQLGLTWGVEHSLASNASVLTLTIPVLTAIMAVILLGERMTAVRWLSFVLAICGVLMVSDIDWHSVQIFKGTYLWGNLLLFASCLGSAFYNTYSKKLLETFNPVELLVYSFLVTDLELLVLMLFLEPPSVPRLLGLGWSVWGSLLTIALFSLSLSMLLFFWVIEKIDVTQASLSIYLLPVFGVLLSTIFVREKVTAQLVTGGLLVFTGTFLVTVYEERKRGAAARKLEKEQA
ncbi:MAG TPA: DMT family transporter [Bryobacteraceae bacterium]|nr:DMT family transporter [Bryobacteraceae bacterium]